MNKSTYLFKVLFALVLTIVFVRCQDDPIETAAPQVSPVAPIANLTQKSAKLGEGSVLTKINLSVINGAVSDLDSALGVLDLIELEDINGNVIQIWDSIEAFDFLDLEKGILNDIAIVPIPTGIYTKAICHILSARVEYGGKDYDCIVPGENMILEFKDPIVVGYQLSPELTLEIDMSKSFYPVYSKSLYRSYIMYLVKLRGKPNWKKDFITFSEFKKNKKPKAFVMNPIIEAINTTTSGAIAGAVVVPTDETFTNFAPIPGAYLELKDPTGLLIADTTSFEFPFYDEYNIPWNVGDFLFKDIPEGTYNLVVTVPGFIMFDPYTQTPLSVIEVYVLRGNFNVVSPTGAVIMIPESFLVP